MIGEPMQRYDVHIYAVVRVKVTGIDARTPAEATRLADDAVDLHGFQIVRIDGASEVEWAEDVQGYLVDARLDGDLAAAHSVDKHNNLM